MSDEGEDMAYLMRFKKKMKRINENRHKVTHFITVDVEATGPNIIDNFMPEFAASFWEIGDEQPLSTFYRCVSQPPNTKWDEETKSSFWDNPLEGRNKKIPPMVDHLQRMADNKIVSPLEAMLEFLLWVRECNGKLTFPKESCIILVDTAEFDTSFMNAYLGKYVGATCPNLNRVFGEYRPVRDIDSFYHGCNHLLAPFGAEQSAMSYLAIKQFPAWVDAFKATHDPLADANTIGARASFLLNFMNNLGVPK